MTTDDQLLRMLRAHFGHTEFRAGQRDVIRAVLAKRPTLAVMPTGLGKSLCFQLPALMLDGLTVVVSPLVALMKDQVDQLRQRGIAAAYLNSTQDSVTRDAVEAALKGARLKLLYVAPERFHSPHFRQLVNRQPPVLVAVDEAHCVSEWGHTFRPDYEKLGEVLAELQPPHLIALTATATSDVRADIIRSLRMRQPFVSVSGFDRPNIHLEVHALRTDAEKRDTLLKALGAGKPAIVYAATRQHAAGMATHLVRQGVSAAAYHGGLATDLRHRIQERFQSGELDVVVGTNAFGLGINKQDVRLVVHTELPRSLEAYYQELGRAGRDGRPATATTFFAHKDVGLLRRLIELSHPPQSLVFELHRRLSLLTRPIGLSVLARNLPMKVFKSQIVAATAFLESSGCAERRYTAPPLVLQFARGVSRRGESAISQLARLARGARGAIDPGEATRTLGLSGPEELHALLDRLEGAGLLSRPEREPEPVYSAVPGIQLGPEHLQRLAMRAQRDRARLKQMISLASQRTCRRVALLHALGEEYDSERCGSCDICAGHKVTAVRSRLPPELRPDARVFDVSPPLVTVTSRAGDTTRRDGAMSVPTLIGESRA